MSCAKRYGSPYRLVFSKLVGLQQPNRPKKTIYPKNGGTEINQLHVFFNDGYHGLKIFFYFFPIFCILNKSHRNMVLHKFRGFVGHLIKKQKVHNHENCFNVE